MDARISLQPVFVLHSRHYGESSIIVEALTKDYGRISLLAKGYRARKKRPFSLQPFSEILMSWLGRGELKTLTTMENSTLTEPLVGKQLYAALYINELLLRLLQKFDSHPQVFLDYQSLLRDFLSQVDIEASLRVFEFRLLAELGYGIDLRGDAQTSADIRADQYYRYLADQGFYPLAKVDERSEVFMGEDLVAIRAGDYTSLNTRRAAKRLIRLAMAPHLGGKPLKSRELFSRLNSGDVNRVNK